MVNTSELLIKTVIPNKPNYADRLKPKRYRGGSELVASLTWLTILSVKRKNLTHCVTYPELGKPV